MITLFIILWLLAGFIAAGFDYAYFQKNWPNSADKHRKEDRDNALFYGLLFGPIYLIVLLSTIRTIKYGWLLPGKNP